MCEAEEKWANELFSDGLIEGRIEGRREGYREGIVDLTKRVMKILGKTLEDTMAYLQLPMRKSKAFDVAWQRDSDAL